jgi:hypothetical protein
VAPADYNLIEAFDQPWKRDLEGAMGGHWGVLDHQGQIKVTFKGPLPARIDPAPLMGGVLAGSLLSVALFSRLGRSWSMRDHGPIQGVRRAGALVFGRPEVLLASLLAGACLGPLAVLQYQMIALWSRSPAEWGLGGLYALTALLTSLFALHHALTGHQPGGLARMVVVLMMMTLAQAVALLFDGRYRPLVWPMLLGPGIALLLVRASHSTRIRWSNPAWPSLALTQPRAHPGGERPRLTRVCAGALLMSAVALVAIEGTANTQALQAALLWAVLAAGALAAGALAGLDPNGKDTSHVQARSGK